MTNYDKGWRLTKPRSSKRKPYFAEFLECFNTIMSKQVSSKFLPLINLERKID